WTNASVKAAAPPCTAPGDLTVGPGVTLTIDPGVTLNFATSDIMAAYSDTSKAELRVAGTIVANGTAASPITITSTGAGAGAWYGINFLSTATNSSLKRAVVDEAVYGLWYQSLAGTNTIAFDTFTGSSY